MPTFAVTCANRENGREYRIIAEASDRTAAAKAAAEDGHLAGDVVELALSVEDRGAVVDEIRGLREDLRTMLQVKRLHRGLQYRIVWALILFVPVAFVVFGGIWFVMQIVNEVVANRQQ